MGMPFSKFRGRSKHLVLASTQTAVLQFPTARCYRVELNAPGSFAFVKLPMVSQNGVAAKNGWRPGGPAFMLVTPCNQGDIIVLDAQGNFVAAIAPNRMAVVALIDDQFVRGRWKVQNLTLTTNCAPLSSSSTPPSSSAPASSSAPSSSSTPASSSAPATSGGTFSLSPYSPPTFPSIGCWLTNKGTLASSGTIIFTQFTRTGGTVTTTCTDTVMPTNGSSIPNSIA